MGMMIDKEWDSYYDCSYITKDNLDTCSSSSISVNELVSVCVSGPAADNSVFSLPSKGLVFIFYKNFGCIFNTKEINLDILLPALISETPAHGVQQQGGLWKTPQSL